MTLLKLSTTVCSRLVKACGYGKYAMVQALLGLGNYSKPLVKANARNIVVRHKNISDRHVNFEMCIITAEYSVLASDLITPYRYV